MQAEPPTGCLPLHQVAELEQLQRENAALEEQLQRGGELRAAHRQLKAAIAGLEQLRGENLKLQKLKQQVGGRGGLLTRSCDSMHFRWSLLWATNPCWRWLA
jgi:type II secretory pathway component PulJ